MYNDFFHYSFFTPLVYDVNFTGDAVVKVTQKSGVRRGSDFGELFDNAAITSGSRSSHSLSAKGIVCLYKSCVYVYI